MSVAILLSIAAGTAISPTGPPVLQAQESRETAPTAREERTPFGYLSAGGLADKCSDHSAFSISYCYAYLAGIHDAMRAYEVWLGQSEFCPPAQVAQNDLRDVYVAFIRSNPKYSTAQSASVAVVALKDAYSCKSAKR